MPSDTYISPEFHREIVRIANNCVKDQFAKKVKNLISPLIKNVITSIVGESMAENFSAVACNLIESNLKTNIAAVLSRQDFPGINLNLKELLKTTIKVTIESAINSIVGPMGLNIIKFAAGNKIDYISDQISKQIFNSIQPLVDGSTIQNTSSFFRQMLNNLLEYLNLAWFVQRDPISQDDDLISQDEELPGLIEFNEDQIQALVTHQESIKEQMIKFVKETQDPEILRIKVTNLKKSSELTQSDKEDIIAEIIQANSAKKLLDKSGIDTLADVSTNDQHINKLALIFKEKGLQANQDLSYNLRRGITDTAPQNQPGMR